MEGEKTVKNIDPSHSLVMVVVMVTMITATVVYGDGCT